MPLICTATPLPLLCLYAVTHNWLLLLNHFLHNWSRRCGRQTPPDPHRIGLPLLLPQVDCCSIEFFACCHFVNRHCHCFWAEITVSNTTVKAIATASALRLCDFVLAVCYHQLHKSQIQLPSALQSNLSIISVAVAIAFAIAITITIALTIAINVVVTIAVVITVTVTVAVAVTIAVDARWLLLYFLVVLPLPLQLPSSLSLPLPLPLPFHHCHCCHFCHCHVVTCKYHVVSKLSRWCLSFRGVHMCFPVWSFP